MGSNPTCSAFIVLVGMINYMGFGVPPLYRTAVLAGWACGAVVPGWVGVAGVGRHITLR